MANRALAWLLSLVIFGLLAVYLEQYHDILLWASAQYEVTLPFGLGARPVVVDSTKDITYIGSLSPGVEHFQNIFYAEDTSGKNRFAPPVPVKPARGSVVDATQPGAWCPQGVGDVLPFTSRVVNISENCLSLGLARPRGTKSGNKLPVMVWLHGGGHALGSAYEVLYEPHGIVKQAAADGQPLIFIAINYRLGLFGFASSKALIEAKHTNAGLRDQRAALEWIRDNIENFGGDPQRVTVTGQSVGAVGIGLHLTSFGGKRGVPFQQAIAMSGGPNTNFNTKPDAVISNTAAIAQAAGCTEQHDSQSAEVIDCLREAPVDVLTNLSVSASRAASPPFGEGYFYPTYDGDYIVDRPSQSMRSGSFVKGIPMIAAWVTNDGAWYAPPPTSTDEEVLASVSHGLPGLSEPTKKKLLDLYPLSDFEHMVRPDYDGPISPQYYRAAQIKRDLWFTCPVLDFAWQYVRHGGIDASQMRLYEHNSTRYTPAYEQMGVPMWRVAHLSDIPYVLNTQRLGGGADNSAAQLQLSKLMSQRIAKFISSGSPVGDNYAGSQAWPPAFANATQEALGRDFPEHISLKLIGGPHNDLPVTIRKGEADDDLAEATIAVRWEKVFERCEFISSEKVREELGV
ncbi:lipase [Hypoxylon sp. FL1284]|nr:lipase [Hypoxylon sp. FL1284]